MGPRFTFQPHLMKLGSLRTFAEFLQFWGLCPRMGHSPNVREMRCWTCGQCSALAQHVVALSNLQAEFLCSFYYPQLGGGLGPKGWLERSQRC